ncbi:CLUMA_CG017587, isoform A [Clunio marinus]|uniref:CLUMA_CG017587, isoform A n=1 Tax=Clunio marinus TaxID=568069 RepID=A0A1J1IW51_9DIPT|nr:CLUMA_CG017587, isoform A [Clunio marinus]
MTGISFAFILQIIFCYSLCQGNNFHQSFHQSSSHPGHNGGVSSNFISSGDNSITINRRVGHDKEYIDYLRVSNPKIIIDGDYFSCSSLVCPKSAFKCEVVSEAIADDIGNMKTTAECFNANDESLERKEFTEVNPYPGVNPLYSRYAIVDKDGAMSVKDSNGNNVHNTAKHLTKEEQEQLNNEIEQQQKQFQQQMNEFNKNMQQAFGNGFPFGNSNPFGNGFPFGNTNQFNNFQPYAYRYPYFPFNSPNYYSYNHQNYDTDPTNQNYYQNRRLNA